MQIPLKRHLHQRYLHFTAALALFIGLTVSAVQGYRDYRAELKQTNDTVLHLVEAAMPSAALASYSLDPYLGQRVVDGLTLRSAIYSARLVTDLGDTLAEAHVRKGTDQSRFRRMILEAILGTPHTLRRPLSGTLANQNGLDLGYLEVAVAPSVNGEAFLSRASMSLAAVLIQTLLLCGALTLVYMRTTSRPLRTVVDALQSMDHSNTRILTELPIPDSHADNEIGYMVRAFNTQLRAAHIQIIARRHAEDGLRHANEELEARVAERTSYLNHEISERRAMETALRHSESRFRDLAEISSDWFWECDEQGRLVAVSERILQTCGLEEDDVVDLSFVHLLRHRLVRIVSPSFNLRSVLLLTPEQISVELALRSADGSEVRSQVAGKRMTSATGVFLGYRGTGHDITRQVEDAEKLRLATSEAERANAAKSEFLANMSHELRTPMNAILGFAQLLRMQRQNPLAASQVQYVNHIVDAGEHLLGLINDVLDLARIEAGHLDLSLESFDLLILAEECVDMLRPLAEEKSVLLTFKQTASSKVVSAEVWADRVRLKQVLINLVSNAIKYNIPQGKVDVAVDVIVRPSGEPALEVSVRDTGIGIPREHLTKIFDPFHRVSAATQAIEGTGVGLAVTRRLLEAMNGTIAVESTLGKGSTFRFSLIARDETIITAGLSASLSGGESTRAPLPTFSDEQSVGCDFLDEPLTVLYVEDNPANQDLMQTLVEDCPSLTLVLASSCADALTITRTLNPDLALLDINLPDGDGASLARALRTNPSFSPIKLIAVSANVRTQDIDCARAAGFDDYLCKPFVVNDVITLIRQCQDSKQSKAPNTEFGAYI